MAEESQTIPGTEAKNGPSPTVTHSLPAASASAVSNTVFEKGMDIQRLSEDFLRKMAKEERRLRNEYASLEKNYSQRDSCTFCKREGKSVKHCHECDQFLCSTCVENHTFLTCADQSMPTEVVPAADDSNGCIEMHCMKHESKEFSMFCTTCDLLLCIDCVSPDHSEHTVQEISNLIQELREKMQSGIEKLSVYREKSQAVFRQLSHKAQTLVLERLESMRELKERLYRIVTALLEQENTIRKDILSKTTRKFNEVYAKRASVRSLDSQVDQYLELGPKYLEKQDFQLLKDRKCLLDQLASLEKTTNGFLNQESVDQFVESNWCFQMLNEPDPFSEAAAGASTFSSFVYTNGKTGTPSSPQGSSAQIHESESLQNMLRAFQQSAAKNLNDLAKPRTCPGTQFSASDASLTEKSDAYLLLNTPSKRNGRRTNDPKAVGSSADEEEDEIVQIQKYMNSSSYRDDDGSSRDSDYSDYDPILQTALNETRARNNRRASSEAQNSSGAQAYYDSDSDYSGVSDKIKEWTKAAAAAKKAKDEDNAAKEEKDGDDENSTLKQANSKKSTGKVTGVDGKPKTARRQVEISANYVSRAKRDSRGRVPKNLEGFKLDLPGSQLQVEKVSPTKPKATTSPDPRGKRRTLAKDEPETKAKEEPESKKPKSEPSASKGKTRGAQVKEGGVDLKPSVKETPAKAKPKGKKVQIEEEEDIPQESAPLTPKKTRQRISLTQSQPEPKPKGKRGQMKAANADSATQGEPVSAKKSRKQHIEIKPEVQGNNVEVKAEAEEPGPSKPEEPVLELLNKEQPLSKPEPAGDEQLEAAVPSESEPKQEQAVTGKNLRTRRAVIKAPPQPRGRKSQHKPETVDVPKTISVSTPDEATQAKNDSPTNGGKGRAKPTKPRMDPNNGVTNELDYVLTSATPDKDKMKITSDDKNEDYCTVCLDGGGVLICCDLCPKVFHADCHLPALKGVPEDDWQCLFCTKKEDLGSIRNEEESARGKQVIFPKDKTISDGDFIYLCKFLSELFDCKESLVVRGLFERILQTNNEEEPVHLNYIRTRVTLQKPEPFGNIEEIIAVIRKMIGLAEEYYLIETEPGKRARTFKNKFNDLLVSYYPDKV